MYRKMSFEKSNIVFKVDLSTLALDEETPPQEMSQFYCQKKTTSAKKRSFHYIVPIQLKYLCFCLAYKKSWARWSNLFHNSKIKIFPNLLPKSQTGRLMLCMFSVIFNFYIIL